VHLRSGRDRRGTTETIGFRGIPTGHRRLAREIELFYGAGKKSGGAGWRAFGVKPEEPVFEGNL
jgi:hypothetical protein